MPLYTFECSDHGEFDVFLSIGDLGQYFECPHCNQMAKRVIVLGHGGIQRTGDSLPWVRDVAKVLGDGEAPNPNIQTVQDLRHYYETHPNTAPAESHPAIPSYIGDIERPPTPDQMAKDRSKYGHELIRKMRRIEINTQPNVLLDKPKAKAPAERK